MTKKKKTPNLTTNNRPISGVYKKTIRGDRARHFFHVESKWLEVLHNNEFNGAPKLLDYFHNHRRPWLYLIHMERLRGSLAHVINDVTGSGACIDCEPMPPVPTDTLLIDFLFQIVCITTYLHKVARVAHCDIKPLNICVGNEPGDLLLRFIDYEYCAHIRENGQIRLTDQRGTRGYTAPEVERARTPLDCRVDVWSLGVTAFEMATGTDMPDHTAHMTQQEVCEFIMKTFAKQKKPRSHEILSFIGECLTVERSQRPYAHELLTHALFYPPNLSTRRRRYLYRHFNIIDLAATRNNVDE